MTQRVYGTGDNSFGLLGLGDAVDRSSYTYITSIEDPSKIFGGDNGTFAIKSDNTLWYSGANNFFSESPNDYLFDQVSSDSWREIAISKAVYTTSLFWAIGIKNNGTLWFIGDNQYGVRGDGTNDSTFYSTWQQIGTATNWVTCAAGSRHAAAINSSGALFTWGTNTSSQLGTGNSTNYFTPTQIAASGYSKVYCTNIATIVLNTSNAMLACGTNNSYIVKQQSGTLGTVYNTLTSSNALTWTEVSASNGAGIGIDSTNKLYIWGSVGQGGINTSPNQFFLREVKALDGSNLFVGKSGTYSKCAVFSGSQEPVFAILTSSKQLYTWGYNDQGQLGRGYVSTSPAYYPTSSVLSGSSGVTKVADNVNALGQSGLDTSFIFVTNPVASFTTTKSGENTVIFTNTSTDAASYTIDWGDGTTTNVANNSATGAPGVGTLSHTYTTSSDTQYTITLTAKITFQTGIDISDTATSTFNVFVTQSPTFSVIEENTGPYVIVRNTSPNTLGATSVFGSGNKWRWQWGDGTFTDVDAGSGLPGSRNVDLKHTFTFSPSEIAAGVAVTRSVSLLAYNGHGSSPFSVGPVTVTVIPVNPAYPNIDTTAKDTSITDIFYAPGGIIWGKP